MLERVYLTSGLFVRVAENESFALVNGMRDLRIETPLNGLSFFDLNDDIEDPAERASLVSDTTAGREITDDIEEVGAFTYEYTQGGETQQTTFVYIDLASDGLTFDSYVIPVAGDPFPDVPLNADLFEFLEENDGRETANPPGFGDSAFVPFRSLDNFEVLGAIEGSDGISTADARLTAYFYEAAFDRMPDLPGLNFWIDQVERGLGFEAMGEFFIASDEFTDVYGDIDSLTNSEFIDLMYLNVLERNADTAGDIFWTGILDAGNSRAFVLLEFAKSVENIADSRYIIGLDEIDETPGIWEFA